MDPRLALALAAFQQGRPDDARTAAQPLLGPGVAHETAFAAASLLFQIAALLHRQGHLERAEATLRSILTFAPADAPTLNNLGLVLDDLGRPREACDAFERAINADPSFSMAYNNWGTALAGQGLYVAATTAYEAALRSDPVNGAARGNLGVALLERGDLDAAAAAFDAVLAEDPENRAAADNRLYLDIYREADPARIYARHQAWGAKLAPPGQVPSTLNRRLRIGYVSADFRRHSVSFFVEGLLTQHDPAVVDVFCYADVARPDAMTARLQALGGHWRMTADWADDRLVQEIRNDGIDILVDLAGHTTGNRLGVFARRAAPIQVTALGYPATTGVPAMDARFCDGITDPPGADGFATERLVRLSVLHCFTPPHDAPVPEPLPALRNGYVTFGSFNKLAKISDATVRLWADILRAVPGSHLLLKTKPLAEAVTRARVVARFAACGILSERLDLRGWEAEDTDHLRAYHAVDIALDTFPYNGTTTTCEALWMGVPVLTFAGQGHAARVGASLMTSAGLHDWVGRDAADLRDRALQACADLPRLAGLRAALRARVGQSRLCNSRVYARDVERAYREMS